MPGSTSFSMNRGVTTDLLRRYGRSPRGTRLADHTPCSHWQTHTVIAALRLDGLDGDGGVRWADRQRRRSAPTSSKSWCPRCARAMSSCSTISRSTNSPRCARRSSRSGAHLRFLPPYSPDFNPIELAFAKLKAFLRAAPPAHLRPGLRADRDRARALHARRMRELRQALRLSCYSVIENALAGCEGCWAQSAHAISTIRTLSTSTVSTVSTRAPASLAPPAPLAP